MKIEEVEVFGLNTSIEASGFPKRTNNLSVLNDISINSLKRAKKLSNVDLGSGHDCFLKGITVQYTLTCSHVFLIQKMRYHFWDIIASTSKMHCIEKMDIKKQCNEYIDDEIINIVNKYKENYINNQNKENFYKLIYNIPLGFNLTMRCTSNYLQLKSMYAQRKTHKLYEWTIFCDWIKSLPYYELITKEK